MDDAGRVCESPGCAHRVTVGFRLCGECRQVVGRELCSLPGLYHDCEGRLAGGPQGTVQRVSRTRPLGVDLNEAAVRVRADVVDILSSWCALVVQERGVLGPGSRVVEDLAVFLDMNLGWLAGHDAAGDFSAEIRELADSARKAADKDPKAPQELGTCDQQGCGQTVFAAAGEVRCAAGHTWRPAEWLSLSRRMQHGKPSGQRSRRRRSGRRS